MTDARDAAEAGAASQLVAIYLRESGLLTPRPVPPGDPVAARVGADGGGSSSDPPGLVRIPLPAAGAELVARAPVVSAAGHHRFTSPWLVGPGAPPVRLTRAADVAALVATELLALAGPPAGPARGAGGGVRPAPAPVLRGGPTTPAWAPGTALAEAPAAGSPEAAERVADLRRRVGTSVARVAAYRARRATPSAGTADVLDAPDPGMAAEAGLVSGHPFHPAPKYTRGFGPGDADRYAPELGVAFPLAWVAVPAAQLVREDVGGLEPGGVPADVRRAAAGRGAPPGWELIPCHPRQAAVLAGRGDLGEALVLGELGGPVRPTSSVRTVRLPAGDHWKLALDVQVTNFVRRNTRTEVRRALDACRVLAALDPGGRPLGTVAFEVLLETGVRAVGASGVRAVGASGDGGDDLFAATAAVHRRAARPGPVPLVVAALLEPDVRTGVTPLGRLLRRAAAAGGTSPATVARPWLRSYLGVSLRPLLRLLVAEGVSLEAHPQNALAGFVGGWPRRLVVRDLEGTSIDRDHPRADRHRRAIGRDASPVLYAPEDAWRRFAYHVVVNHVGHVVATLATESGVGEASLWPEVAAALAAEAAGAPTPEVAGHLAAVLLGPTLPAKANLLGTLLGRADRPVYVPVPTPYRAPTPAAAVGPGATGAVGPAAGVARTAGARR